ncbi:MAG: esterase/lipase family protein [Fidelibacterota bacterium]
MKKYRNIILGIFFFLHVGLMAGNSYPIVLVHGFIGWGRDELNEYYYWGGKFDLESYLKAQGFQVYTVSVGPISSNFDRAVEMFYQIKGGQVDYGAIHSKEYGLIRKPPKKNYHGLYPQWDAEHPVHIIGHSMGGQTATMLETLLKESNEKESSELLGKPLNGWIKSITTISTPHNGTTLQPIVTNMFPFIQKLVVYLGGIQEGSSVEKLYDFDLEQWGLERDPDEEFRKYIKRIRMSDLAQTKNFCAWDLSIEGASQFNEIYHPDTSVYYFSYATYATRLSNHSSYQVPDEQMIWRIWSTGFLMGRSEIADSLWWENDGVVNTISMWGPGLSNSDIQNQIDFSGTPIPGKWQRMGKLHYNHESVIGHAVKKGEIEDIKQFFNDHCSLLYSLD